MISQPCRIGCTLEKPHSGECYVTVQEVVNQLELDAYTVNELVLDILRERINNGNVSPAFLTTVFDIPKEMFVKRLLGLTEGKAKDTRARQIKL